MRWLHKRPEIGDRRVVRKFLWLPLKLADESRWLESAYIHQVYTGGYGGPDGCTSPFWRSFAWAEPSDLHTDTKETP